MVERCLVGWQEIEYEVMRDADDTCIAVCSMENVDPLGVHTGDSIVVAPVQTLTDAVHQRLRSAALAIIRALGVEGGCNVQFALSPDSTEYAVIEVNPRVSRSSALASKATGYPIARVAAQIAVGRRLAEIPNVVTGTTVAAFEPALDYVVVKLPRFPFDKFPGADRTLGSQMKATGEVMAIDRTFGSALNKALRGLEQAGVGPLAEDAAWTPTFDYLAGVYAGDPDADEPIRWVDEAGQACESTRHAQRTGRPDRAAPVPRPPRTAGCGGCSGCSGAACRRRSSARRPGSPRGSSRRWAATSRSRREVTAMGARLADAGDAEAAELLATVKRAGFGDRELAGLAGTTADELRAARLPLGLVPGYAMVDTCAAEFAAETPYFYSTYAAAGSAPEAPPVERPAALVIGSGPVRIGQGIEFDYCAVQAADTLRRAGWSAVMINSNPETVSTDFDASSRLYFEPLDPESVRSVIDAESPAGVDLLPAVVAFGGQTPLNLAAPLAAGGVPLLGSDLEAIDQAEERTRFSALLDRLGIPQPEGGMAHSVDEALTLAERIGYPVIVRPSFVIGGLAIDFCYSPEDLERQLAMATVVDPDRPVRIDRYLEGIEVDVDAISDGERVLIPGLLEHVERAGRPLGRLRGDVPAADRVRRRPGPDRRHDGADRAGAGRARPRQRPVHRPRGRRLPHRGQPARLADRAVHVEGHRRADGRAGGADLAGRHASRAGLGRRAAAATAVRRGQGPRVLDGQAARGGSVRRARDAVHRRGDRACTPTRGWRSPRRCSGRHSCRRGRARPASWRCSRSRTATRGRCRGSRRRSRRPATGWRRRPGTRARAGRRRLRGPTRGQARRGGGRARSARSRSST